MSPFSKEMHSRHKLGIRSYIYQVSNKPIGSQQRLQFPLAYTSSPHPHMKCPRELDLHVWPATRLSTSALVSSPSRKEEHLTRACEPNIWSSSTCLQALWPWGRDNLPWIVFSSVFEIWGLDREYVLQNQNEQEPWNQPVFQVSIQDPNWHPPAVPASFFRSTVSTLSFWGLRDCTQIKRLVNCGHFINALLVFVPFL